MEPAEKYASRGPKRMRSSSWARRARSIRASARDAAPALASSRNYKRFHPSGMLGSGCREVNESGGRVLQAEALPTPASLLSYSAARTSPTFSPRASGQHGTQIEAEHVAPVERAKMLHYAVVFFIIALIAAVFGFGGIAAGAVGIAKVLFFVFLILAAVSFIANMARKT